MDPDLQETGLGGGGGGVGGWEGALKHTSCLHS